MGAAPGIAALVAASCRTLGLAPAGGRTGLAAVALATVTPELRKSFTYDRGSEMARHEELTAATGMPVFFCEPYSPWQRGSNENTNGLVRQFLPKGMDLSTVTPQQLAYFESMLNDRPRKVLGFRTPREVYSELIEKHRSRQLVKSSEFVALQS